MNMIYIVSPTILIAVVLAAVWLDRWSVPVILIALGAGIFFGSDVLNVTLLAHAREEEAIRSALLQSFLPCETD